MSDGKFKILQKIDSGGMAEVYKGIQTSTPGIEKLVAIKRILPHLTKNQKFVDMFLDEARVSMHLSHANIVQVFDLGQANETYFIVMEYIDGTNLKALGEYFRNQNRIIPVEQAVFIAAEICKGLAYAHNLKNPVTGKSLHIVHRDISPPNILLSRGGEIKIVDFGLAKAVNQISETDQGVVKGKFSYLSPEAATVESEIDKRSDVFAVGIVLWELLAKKRLFYGETDFHTIELVRKAQVPSLSSLNSQVPEELEHIIRTALARDVETRYQSARDFGDALTQFLFNKALKVSSYDLVRLVDDVMAARAAKTVSEEPSLIHELIQDELLKFSSIGNEAEQLREANNSANPSEPLIDTREWDLLGIDAASQFGSLSEDTKPPSEGSELIGDLASISSPDWRTDPSFQESVNKVSSPEESSSGSYSRMIFLIVALVVVLLAGSVGVYAYLTGMIGGNSSSVTHSSSTESP